MSLNGTRTELERRLAAGERFDEIEGFIDSLSLSKDEKAALWLLAWTYQERSTQLRLVEESLKILDPAPA